MSLNKPKYNLFKNGMYALEGFVEVSKNERSFQLQLLFFVVMSVIAWTLPIKFVYVAILSLSLLIPIMAELTNSAIERVVDLVTKEHHILAKHAKDAGAALVFVSLVFTGLVWIATLVVAFELI